MCRRTSLAKASTTSLEEVTPLKPTQLREEISSLKYKLREERRRIQRRIDRIQSRRSLLVKQESCTTITTVSTDLSTDSSIASAEQQNNVVMIENLQTVLNQQEESMSLSIIVLTEPEVEPVVSRECMSLMERLPLACAILGASQYCSVRLRRWKQVRRG